MFGGGRKKKGAIESTKLSSLIADNLQVVGDLHFSGGLRIDGRIEGNVSGTPGGKSLIVLSANGSIAGNAKVYDAVINGTIVGDIEVEHFLELQSNAKISGNVRYRQLQMACGAVVDGNLTCVAEEEQAKEPTPAAVFSETHAEELVSAAGKGEPELMEEAVKGR